MLEIGRVCVKTAGRDSGKLAVVIKKLDDNHVMVDGNVRRKKCGIAHLEPTKTKLEIKEEASTSDVFNAMKKAGLEVTKSLEKKKWIYLNSNKI